MAIRTKAFKFKGHEAKTFRAIQITEKNLDEVVAYILRNGGAATGHLGNTASGRPARIRIKQRNYGSNWGKRDWRVAKLGDWIVKHTFDEDGYGRKKGDVEFERIKNDDFILTAEPA